MEKTFEIDGFLFEDSTIYSRNDKQRVPTTYSIMRGTLRITITCGHRDYPNIWVFHCFNLGFHTVSLGPVGKEQAAKLAIEKCRQRANYYTSLLN